MNSIIIAPTPILVNGLILLYLTMSKMNISLSDLCDDSLINFRICLLVGIRFHKPGLNEKNIGCGADIIKDDL